MNFRKANPLVGQGYHWSCSPSQRVIFGHVATYNSRLGKWELPSIVGPEVPDRLTEALTDLVKQASRPHTVVITANAAMRLATTEAHDSGLAAALVRGNPQEYSSYVEVPLKVAGKKVRIRILSRCDFRPSCMTVEDKNGRELVRC
jgi:hypothetical protein